MKNLLIWNGNQLFAFTLTACLFYEFIAYRKSLGREEARRIQRIDLMYGISSGLLIAVGLLRVFYFEKGPNYYFHNYVFWTKMALFAIVGMLSFYPTNRFAMWKSTLKEDRAIEIPDDEFKRVRVILLLEIAGIVLILFAVPMMARGIGMS